MAALVSFALVALYAILYPIRGFHVALGSDTPLYVWWAQRTGELGFTSLLAGGRPVTIGAIAALADVTRLPVGPLTAPFAPVSAVCVGLAMAAFVDVSLGRDRLRFALTAAFTTAFLSLLVPGYLATLVFGAAFVGALACLAAALSGRPDGTAPVPGDGHGAPVGPARGAAGATAAALVLMAGAGLAHPLFLLLAGAIAGGAGVALIPSTRRQLRAGVPARRTPGGRLVVASAGGAAVAGGVIAALGSAPRAPADWSRDALLRRLGLTGLIGESFRRVLFRTFPWYRATTTVGLAALSFAGSIGGFARPRSDRTRLFWGAVFAWVLVSGAGVALLLAGTLVPGQRLAAFCLALPALGAIAVRRLALPPPRSRRPAARRAAAWVLAALFLGVAGLFWQKQQPLITEETALQLQAAGAALTAEPPGTPLILLVNETTDKLGFVVPRSLNYLRAAVPPDRADDVYVFVGTAEGILRDRPVLNGEPEHDRIALDAWRRISPLLRRTPRPLAVILRGVDRSNYDGAFLTPPLAGPVSSFQLADGVITVPGLSGSVPVRMAGARALDPSPAGVEPFSPWLPVWSSPVLLLLLALLGLPWAWVALEGTDALTRLALAPAAGLAGLGLASIAVDAAGLRLANGGGIVAAAVVLSSGVALMRVRRVGPFARPRPPRGPARRSAPERRPPAPEPR